MHHQTQQQRQNLKLEKKWMQVVPVSYTERTLIISIHLIFIFNLMRRSCLFCINSCLKRFLQSLHVRERFSCSCKHRNETLVELVRVLDILETAVEIKSFRCSEQKQYFFQNVHVSSFSELELLVVVIYVDIKPQSLLVASQSLNVVIVNFLLEMSEYPSFGFVQEHSITVLVRSSVFHFLNFSQSLVTVTQTALNVLL